MITPTLTAVSIFFINLFLQSPKANRHGTLCHGGSYLSFYYVCGRMPLPRTNAANALQVRRQSPGALAASSAAHRPVMVENNHCVCGIRRRAGIQRYKSSAFRPHPQPPPADSIDKLFTIHGRESAARKSGGPATDVRSPRPYSEPTFSVSSCRRYRIPKCRHRKSFHPQLRPT